MGATIATRAMGWVEIKVFRGNSPPKWGKPCDLPRHNLVKRRGDDVGCYPRLAGSHNSL